MIEKEIEYIDFIKSAGVGSNDRVSSSIDSYISYLNSVSKYLKITVSYRVLSDERDIESITRQLSRLNVVADKTIQNYEAAMRQYAAMLNSVAAA